MAKILILIEEDNDSGLAFQPRQGGLNVWLNGLSKLLKLATHTRQAKSSAKIIFLKNGNIAEEKILSSLSRNPFAEIERLIRSKEMPADLAKNPAKEDAKKDAKEDADKSFGETVVAQINNPKKDAKKK